MENIKVKIMVLMALIALSLFVSSANAADLQVYRHQPSPMENDKSFSEMAITVYNPNNYSVTITNVNDTWNIDKVIKDASSIISCTPTCTASGVTESVSWTANYTIAPRDIQIFKYQVKPNGPHSPSTANVTFSTNATTPRINTVTIADHAAVARLRLSIDSGSTYNFSKVLLEPNTTYPITMEIAETATDKKILAAQYVIIDIPTSWTGLVTSDPDVTLNGNQVIYDIQADIKGGSGNPSETFTFNVTTPALSTEPDYLQWQWNSTVNGTDEQGYTHADTLNLFVNSKLPPSIPTVTNPTTGNYSGDITINYTQSFSPQAYAITTYNITLVNETTEAYVDTIASNNYPNLGYVWDSSLYDSSYKIKVVACDNNSLCSNDVSDTILIDNTAPAWVNNQSYMPNFYDPATESMFNITWTDTLTEVNTVILESNYSGSPTNYTMNLIGGVYNYSAILPAGTYYWKSYANDSLGNMNVSDTWTLTLVQDNSPPLIDVITPVNNSNLTTGGDIYLEINATDFLNNVDVCWYSYDSGANQSMTNISNSNWTSTQIVSSNGDHNITFWCNDTSPTSTTNSTTVFFNMNDTTVSYTITTPTNGTAYFSSPIILTVTSSESLSLVNATITGIETYSLTETSPNVWTYNFYPPEPDNYVVAFYIEDLLGNNETTDSIPFSRQVTSGGGGGGFSGETAPPINYTSNITAVPELPTGGYLGNIFNFGDSNIIGLGVLGMFLMVLLMVGFSNGRRRY